MMRRFSGGLRRLSVWVWTLSHEGFGCVWTSLYIIFLAHTGWRRSLQSDALSVRVLSEVCAGVFGVLISSLCGWVVKLYGGSACLSEETELPRSPSSAGTGTLSWAVSSQKLALLRAKMDLYPQIHKPHRQICFDFNGYLLNVKYL